MSKTFYNQNILILIFLTALLWCGNSTITPFLPIFVKKIHLGLWETSLFLGTMGVVRLLVQPFLGQVIALRNEILILRLVFLTLLISSCGYLCSDNFYVLLVCRLLEAVAFAGSAIAVRVIINTHFDSNKINIINNYYSGAQNFGRFIGPAIAGSVIEYAGIKAIFFLTCFLYSVGCLCTRFLKQDPSQLRDETQEPKNFREVLSSKLTFFLLLYAIEFIGLGLWLSSWSIYATETLNWRPSVVGYSFSILALSSIMAVPFLNRISVGHFGKKILLGVLLLSLQPLCVMVFKRDSIIIWSVFMMSGFGAALYFSTFHSYIAKSLSGKNVALFYGLVGSFSFAGQAIGQTIAPFLSHLFSDIAPIELDFAMLLLDFVLYILFFLNEKT